MLAWVSPVLAISFRIFHWFCTCGGSIISHGWAVSRRLREKGKGCPVHLRKFVQQSWMVYDYANVCLGTSC